MEPWEYSWYAWNTGSSYNYNTVSVTNASTDTTWSGWTNRGTGTYYNSYTSSNSATWNTWTTREYHARQRAENRWEPQPLSPEMRMRQERGANRIKLERHFQRIAKLRAKRLLLSVLSPRQREEFRENNAFIVHGSDGGVYELQLGRYHNIFRINEDGDQIEELCGAVEEAVPDEDNLVAQKLWLETNESYFRSLCNIWDITRGLYRGRVQTHQATVQVPYAGRDAAYTRGEILV